MKSKYIIGIVILAALGFLAMKRHVISFGPSPTDFTATALENVVTDLEGNSSNLQEILKKYKGETVIVEVWASWCGDCLKGMPVVKEMQETTADKKVTYLFLSVDEDERRWKKAIDRLGIQGEHYLVEGAWKSKLGDFLKLDWIPRYMVVNPQGSISLYRATKATDPAILETVNGLAAQ